MTDDRERRRAYQRAYAKRKHRRALTIANAQAVTCQRQQGPGRCGGLLRTVTDGDGHTARECPRCLRRRQGICQDCGRPVEGRVGSALRCREHKRIARNVQVRASATRHRAEVNRRAKAAYQTDAAMRERRNAYKRQWRKAHPDQVKAAKRRYTLRYGADATSRYRDYHRRYNADPVRQASKRAAAIATYYLEHPTRPHPVCMDCGREIPWTTGVGGREGRPPRRCTFHRSKYDVRRSIARWVERDATEALTSERTRPFVRRGRLNVRHPMPARYARSGERLCCTPGCDIVLTGRKKKCSKCRARETQAAMAALASVQGRGHRTDLDQRSSA